jgi:hypothetical protein
LRFSASAHLTLHPAQLTRTMRAQNMRSSGQRPRPGFIAPSFRRIRFPCIRFQKSTRAEYFEAVAHRRAGRIRALHWPAQLVSVDVSQRLAVVCESFERAACAASDPLSRGCVADAFCRVEELDSDVLLHNARSQQQSDLSISFHLSARGIFRLAAMTKTLTRIAVLRHASSRCKDIDTLSGLSLFIHLRRVLRLAAVTGPPSCGC